MRTLYIIIKQVYGKDTVYPNCDDSRVFCQLLGRKTLTESDMRHIRTLGYQFEVSPQVLSEVFAGNVNSHGQFHTVL